jgi:hypothetical protein
MSERAGIFESGSDFDVAGFAPQKAKAAPPPEKVRQVSESANFKSREPEKKRPKREARLYRTGRNAQFNIKADPEIIDAFYAITDAEGWVLGETLQRAVEALKRELSSAGKTG